MTRMTNDRRKFLKTAGASLGMAALGGTGAFAAAGPIVKSPNGKSLAGVFPIEIGRAHV